MHAIRVGVEDNRVKTVWRFPCQVHCSGGIVRTSEAHAAEQEPMGVGAVELRILTRFARILCKVKASSEISEQIAVTLVEAFCDNCVDDVGLGPVPKQDFV